LTLVASRAINCDAFALDAATQTAAAATNKIQSCLRPRRLGAGSWLQLLNKPQILFISLSSRRSQLSGAVSQAVFQPNLALTVCRGATCRSTDRRRRAVTDGAEHTDDPNPLFE
jgi:hypothetical protein